jgi:acyl carrier protein
MMNTLETLQAIFIKDYKVPPERLAPEAPLDTLGIDSLGMIELMFKIEDHFHVKIPGDPPNDLRTVHDVVVYIDGLIAAHPARPGASLTAAPHGGR